MSRRHSNFDRFWFEEKRNEALVDWVVALGPEMIVVSGGVRSRDRAPSAGDAAAAVVTSTQARSTLYASRRTVLGVSTEPG